MSRFVTRFLGALLLTCLTALPALAFQYPPGPDGPGGTCDDTLTVINIENAGGPCHPAIGDSVYGVGGICTAFDTKPSGVGFFMQMSNGYKYSGIDVFTANTNWPFARGDSVVVVGGQYTKYSGDPELTSLSGSWGTMQINLISSGNPLPPWHDGTVNEFNSSLANVGADGWAGCLVRVTGTVMRVARVVGTGGYSFYVVDNVICPPSSVGPCDSMFVDQTTLPNPNLGQPALGDMASTIQGIYGLNSTYGPRIRVRDQNDEVWITPCPPHVSDAYSVHNDTIRVVFDRGVTQASAENTARYTLSSGGTVNSATLEANGSCVDLKITNGLSPGDNESVTVNGVISSASCGAAMTNPETRNFYNGVIPMMTVRAPDPDSLLTTPCQDRSLFSGAGSAPGQRLTFRGVCVGVLPGSLWYLEDASRAQRSAVTMYGALGTITTGNQYLFVGALQEYYGETEGVYPVYMRDEGAVTPLDPVVQTVAVLRDSACDVTETLTNGKDYASMLVEVQKVKVTWAPGTPGGGFRVINLGTVGDTISINNRQSSTWTYQADSSDCLSSIRGLLRFDFGNYVISPRSNADFQETGAGVTPTSASKVSFSVFPNPARSATVSFALPRRDDVDLSVFDLSGRKVATLAKGSLPAGQYTREWNGRGVGAGVYFVRLRVGPETYNLRTINLK
jgi:hypothetical protein